jgi:hypothetical protein
MLYTQNQRPKAKYGGMVVQSCNLSYLGSGDRNIVVWD